MVPAASAPLTATTVPALAACALLAACIGPPPCAGDEDCPTGARCEELPFDGLRCVAGPRRTEPPPRDGGVDVGQDDDAGPLPGDAPPLVVELRWDTADGDLDLHLARALDDVCTAEACSFATCRDTSPSPPDWDEDGVPRSAGDPRLDLDDTGFGPEVIAVDALLPGTYFVGVHFFSGSTPARADVAVEVGGAFFVDDSRVLQRSGDFWVAFQLLLDEAGQAFASSPDLCASDACPADVAAPPSYFGCF